MGSAVLGAASAIGVAAALLLCACTALRSGSPDAAAAPPVALPQTAAGPREAVPSALDNMRDPAFHRR
jgi:hypothetical protein